MKSRYLVLLTGLVAAASLGAPAANGNAAGRLVYLDIKGGRVLSANADGSGATVLVSGQTGSPDGIVVDTDAKHLFWTNMGRASADDGSIDRADLDGSHVTRVVPAGGTFTPKQLRLDRKNKKLYWSDREGMRVMRSNLDGSNIETLIETARGDAARKDAANWCVGLALDVDRGKIYWTQKGGDSAGVGSVRRAGIEIPRGEDPWHRSDIDVLFDHLPEPIDLDLDLRKHEIYWTDRGNAPWGNTVNRAPMDLKPTGTAAMRKYPDILVRDLHEAIGIALDLERGRMFLTDLGGHVYSARLDGSEKKLLLSEQGSLTGIAFVEPR